MILERGLRSSLVIGERGDILREFHDTKLRRRVPVRVDDAGTLRIGGNRSVETLLQGRGTQPVTRAPPHIARTVDVLKSRTCRTVSDVGDAMGVKTSTAWCYVCRAVEEDPSIRNHAIRLVFPALPAALRALADTSGLLRDVMERLQSGPLRGDSEWRCVPDRFAHLRLARICATLPQF